MPSRRSLAPAASFVAALAALAAGCGGHGTAGVASVGTSGPAVTIAAQSPSAAFAACMRSHGIPNWPDPTADGGFDKTKLRALGVSGARIRAIEDAHCSHILPANGGPSAATAQQQRTRLTDWLSFARCMRGHDVARFPDPTAQGELTVAMVQAQGIDVRSPAVLRTLQACVPASHGLLTPAKIREALAQAAH